MAAAAALDVEGVHGAARERLERLLDRERLVQPVRVDRELHVVGVAEAQRLLDRGAGGADVLVDLEPGRAREQRLLDRLRAARGAPAEQSDVERPGVERGELALERPRRVGAEVPDRAVVLADDRRHPRRERGLRERRREQVDVRVDGAGGRDQALGRDDRRAGAERDVDAVLDVRVARAADGDDAAVADPDRRLDDSENGVEEEAVRDREVAGAPGSGAGGQPVADRARPAGDRLLAVLRAVVRDLDPEVGVAEAHAVAERGP